MRADDPRFLTHRDRILPGERRVQAVALPAAGADWSVVVPGGRQWRVVGGVATLTTAIAVAARAPLIQLFSQGVAVWLGGSGATVPASTIETIIYVRTTGAPLGMSSGVVAVVPVGDMWLTPGDSISSLTGAMQAADQYTAISLVIEECFFDNTQISEEHLARLDQRYAEQVAAAGPTPQLGA